MDWFSKWIGRKPVKERPKADSAPPSAADGMEETGSGLAAPVDQAQLNDRVSALAGRVVSDPRWPEMSHELGLSVLGMLLFGFASALAGPRVDPATAVAAAMTGPAGVPPKWTGGLLDEARRSARDAGHHPAHRSLIDAGQTYAREDEADVIANVFANLQAYHDQLEVAVFMNPLVLLLAEKERAKGAYLTEAEVLAVRDSALCVRMTNARARAFYTSLDANMAFPRLDPDRIWEEWKEIRDQVEWPE